MSLDWSLVAKLAEIVGTLGGLLLLWWKVRQIRELNAYVLLRDEVKRWNSPEMRADRARLAQALLESRLDFKRIDEQGAEEVTGYFEDIGGLLRRRVVPVYYVWSMLGDYITYYGQLLHDYLAWWRRSTADPTYYEDFDFLRSRIAALQKKRTGLAKVFPEDDLSEFLQDEVKLADGSATTKRHRRMIRFHCPNCKRGLSAPTEKSGQESRCPKCGQPVVVPKMGQLVADK
jgi:hypothetical protein